MAVWPIALRHLWRFPLRSGLALACGGLSAALVIAALNYTEAGSAQLLSQLTAMGSDVLAVAPALSRSVGGRARTGTIVTTLRSGDLEALLRANPEIVASAESSTATALAKAGDLAKNSATVVGVGAAFFGMRRWHAAEGTVFGAPEERRAARVAELGASVAQDLFGGADPVGQRVLLNRIPFAVLGVLAPRGQRLDAVNEDEEILIPFATAQHRLMNRDFDSGMFLQVAPAAAMPAVAIRAAALLRSRHHLAPGQPDDFQIQDQQTLIAAQTTASRHLALLVWAAGAGGLLATGLALLALHSLALGARQRELGLQRALGASIYGLFRQLAAEAALLAAASLALGLSAGWALSRWSEARAGMAPRFDRSEALQVLAIALGFELAAALLPARRAARRDPGRLLA